GRLARKLAQLAFVVLELALAGQRAGAGLHRGDGRREAGAFKGAGVFLLALVDVPDRLARAAADFFGELGHRPAFVARELVDVAALAADQRRGGARGEIGTSGGRVAPLTAGAVDRACLDLLRQ